MRDTAEQVSAALAGHRVVNLVGPLGAGKTRLLTGLRLGPVVDLAAGHPTPAGCATVVLDGIDRAELAEAALATVRADPATRYVVVSRTPLIARPGWTAEDQVTVPLRPWSDERIADLVAGFRLPAGDGLVVRLAGGIPLLAETLCRAVLGGTVDQAALADVAAEAVLERLDRERPGRLPRAVLHKLASVGIGNEELLATTPDSYAALATLSLVRRTELGLSIDEPYRTLFCTAFRWRRPLAHRATLTRASEHQRRRLGRTGNAHERAALLEHGLFLADEPVVREMLFPPRSDTAPIEPARLADTEDIARLVRDWATGGDLDRRRTDRLLGSWLSGPLDHFHVARDEDGRAIGLAHLIPRASAAPDRVDALFQQHAEPLLESDDGLFVVTAFCARPAVHALLLRHILAEGTRHGRIMVSTPTPAYQRLVSGLGFTDHGTTRDDVYGSGHRPRVYSQSTHPEAVAAWLTRLSGAEPEPSLLAGELTFALRHIANTGLLARSPLLAATHTPTVSALRTWLHTAVDIIAASDHPATAEAGNLLRHHYFRRRTHPTAPAHLSRATYFRRLRHGVNHLAELFAEADTG